MMTKEYLVFDVESVGLYGEGYAVAGGVYNLDGSSRDEFCYSCSPDYALGGTDDDRAWIKENVPPIQLTHYQPKEIRSEFWKTWKIEKENNVWLAADCSWPVEARFLLDCVKDTNDNWGGPYPLIDIGSVLLGVGYDPLADYPRLDNELPKHNPLADARQSARLLIEALNRSNKYVAPPVIDPKIQEEYDLLMERTMTNSSDKKFPELK